ncbi:heavy metal translocating P-type ATPase [Oxynema aestuarii]|uniref:Heavy metal translocating P-type ATPase n=1 Tax=Oxynema aestuarii AP17 TaxID=2064643 RepID=A0A6H1TXF3_9CYAN|nr:heavy metal translocating P-type ATPase [Oxynema aestuarii]QIZ71105.1 heavy metal translocating P-type ATPase [Oxynema aestuarii AP17]
MVQVALTHRTRSKHESILGANEIEGTPVNIAVPYGVVHWMPGRIRVRVPRLSCDRPYGRRLQRAANRQHWILDVRLNPAAGCAIVRYRVEGFDPDRLRVALERWLARAEDPQADDDRDPDSPDRAGESWLSELKLPLLATCLAIGAGPLGWSISPMAIASTIAIAAVPVAKRAIVSLWAERRVNIDFLDSLAISITTIQGHFLTSATMVGLIQLGEAIRNRTARSYHHEALDLLSSLARFAWVERGGEKQQVPLEAVEVGDTVIVYPGEQIPVDGRILRGKALVDEQKLTGESIPAVRSPGEAVYASTLVRSGQIYVLTERTGAATLAGRTMQLLQNAPVCDTRMENYAAKIADRAVMPALLLSGAIYALTRNAARAASILTLDFATGIRVSVPTTVMAALSAAGRHGVLIRSGRALEQLAQVDAIVFDKTGTLTQGDVAIVGVKTAAAAIDPMRVVQLAAAGEQRITHPVAEAVMRYANYHELIVPARGEWDYQVGFGLSAQVEGQAVLVGSDRFMVKEGVDLDPLHDRHPEVLTAGYPKIYVACDRRLLGVIQYSDPLRPETVRVLQKLRRFGAEIHMLTGDNRQRAATVARELDIPPSHVHAEAFPEHKAEVIGRLHDRGKTVAFVGDGLNDSAALAYADVSISFGDGSDVARETADVVLMKNNLYGLVEAVAIARHAKQIIAQNTGIVALPNLSGLAIAATVGMNPMTATAINNGSSVVAGVNGLRPVLIAPSKSDRE